MTTNIYVKRGIQILIVLILLWLGWTVGKDWLRPRIIKGLGGYTARDVKMKIDTLEIRYDTVYFKYQEQKIRADIAEGKVINNYQPASSTSPFKGNEQASGSNSALSNQTKDNSIALNSSTSNPIIYDKVFEYINPISDSLIDGNIRAVVNSSDCKLIELGLNYTPKFPKFITKTVTVEKVITETLYDKPKAYFGIGGTANSRGNVGGTLVYQTPKKWQYQAGYQWDTKIGITPDKNTTGAVTVSIIKLF